MTEVVHPEDVKHPPPPRKDRAAAWVADKCATVEFALVNVAIVLAWALLSNEEFPYPFLTLVLSVEAILLSVCVLVQNRLEAQMQKREMEADLKNDAIAAEESERARRQLDRMERKINKLGKPETTD